MFPECDPCKICPCITAESGDERQPNQQFPISIFSYQIDMGQQEAGIEKAKKSRHAFQGIGMVMIQHRINQQYHHKHGNKNIEIIIPVDDVLYEYHIEQSEGITDYMQAFVFFGKCLIKLMHANQSKKSHSDFQPNPPTDDENSSKGTRITAEMILVFICFTSFYLPPKRRSLF